MIKFALLLALTATTFAEVTPSTNVTPLIPRNTIPQESTAPTKNVQQETKTLSRTEAIQTLDNMKTDIFYSEDFQSWLKNKPAWTEIQAKIEKEAREKNPVVAQATKNPFDKLGEKDKNTYRLAQENAQKSPEIKELRTVVQSILNTIESLTELITPGYKEVKEELQKN